MSKSIMMTILEGQIESGWIIKNKDIRLEAISREFEVAYEKIKIEEERSEEVRQMMGLINKHLPDQFREVFLQGKNEPNT